MKHSFLADENVPRICVTTLRDKGFDVSWISEVAASISDAEVCNLAQSAGRIIITNDKDFGDLVMRLRMAVPGVILLRLDGLLPREIADLVAAAFAQDYDWMNHFTVITTEAIRIRPLPGSA